jgi:hypothetical protein
MGVARSIPSHILPKAPILDPNVQIHKMVIEAFDRFDNLQQGCVIQTKTQQTIHPWKTCPMM